MPSGIFVPQNRDNSYQDQLYDLVFQNIPPLGIGNRYDQPSAKTASCGEPEPVQFFPCKVIDHAAENCSCNADKIENLHDSLRLLFLFQGTAGEIIGFFCIRNFFFFQHVQKISLNIILGKLGGKSKNHFVFVRTGTKLHGVGTCENSETVNVLVILLWKTKNSNIGINSRNASRA